MNRCWKIFLQWHAWLGYVFWVFCMVINQSPWYHYVATAVAFLIEEILIVSGSWIFWIIDAPYKAGITFISEYLIIICMRWIVVVFFFELQMLLDIIRVVVSLFKALINQVRKLGRIDVVQPRNVDGTFASSSQDDTHRRPGRPRKK